KGAGNSEELLKNYKLLMALDSTKGKFQSAYRWQREYFSLKQTLDQENKPQLPVNTDSIEDILESEANMETLPTTTNQETANNQDQVKNLKLLSYGLIVAFLIVLTFLLLIYLKR